MRVSLLYLEGCPHWRLAETRLREALRQAGRADVEVERRRVHTAEEGQALGFRGSPTILVDGRDAFGTGDVPVGLACRRYETEAGPDGAPSVRQLVDAVR